MIRVLFVCLGNICRSPMAESLFIDRVRRAGLENQFEIDSAGTGDYHIGERAHPGTRDVLARNRIACISRARQMSPNDFHHFDYIVAMDEANRRDIRYLFGTSPKVSLLLDDAPHLPIREVPDPYFTGDFEGVYTMVGEAVTGLLDRIGREQNLP